jgi:hypothetical protein
VLEQIQSGQTCFAPSTEAPEDLKAFQPAAAALKHAVSLGYISAVFLESRMRDGYGSVRQVLVNGPLSYSGAQFLSIPPVPERHDQDIVQLKPSFYGISIDLRAAFRWLKRKFRR